jgi:hypothetical protein
MTRDPGMAASSRVPRWLLFGLFWAALLAFIWVPAAHATIKFKRMDDGGVMGQFGERFPLYKIAPIENPQPPSRGEIIWRGTSYTLTAIFVWVLFKAANRIDRERDEEGRYTNRKASSRHDA